MENIDRANRFFIFRIPFFPILAVFYLAKRFSLFKFARNYVIHQIDSDEGIRYEKFISFYKYRLMLTNVSFHFLNRNKNISNQTVFIVNGMLDWNSIPLMSYIAKKEHKAYPKFLLNDILINRDVNKFSIFWDLIDTFYGEKDLSRAFASKRPLFVEKSFIERHPMASNKLLENYVPVVPVFHFRKKNKVWYVIGEQIKTFDFVSFEGRAIVDIINQSFAKLENSLASVINKKNNGKKFDLKSLFTI